MLNMAAVKSIFLNNRTLEYFTWKLSNQPDKSRVAWSVLCGAWEWEVEALST